MGIITSRFRGKLSTFETLEKIDKDISSLQRNRRSNQELQKRIAASLLLYSILLYIVAAIVFYFFYFPDNWPDRALYSLPLIIFPFIIWGARKLMHWYFVKRVAAYDFALNELREKRKMILEDVMENETYKKAREILEKFDPARFKKLEKPPSPPNPTPTLGSAVLPVVRQRVVMQQMSPRMAMPQRPALPMTPAPAVRPAPGPMNTLSMPMPSPRPGQIPIRYSPPPGPPMPRTLISRDRGSMEKIIDYLVGDGPQNRYALICRFCHSHNGMALPEEFEYLSFRCCYCYNMNQARKMRPFAPRLEFPEMSPQAKSSPKPGQVNGHKEQSSGDERDSASDLEEEEETEQLEKDGERGDEKPKVVQESSATKLDGNLTPAQSASSAMSLQRGASQTSMTGKQKVASQTNSEPQRGVMQSMSAPQQSRATQGMATTAQGRASHASTTSQQKGGPAASAALQQQVMPQADAVSHQQVKPQADAAQQQKKMSESSQTTQQVALVQAKVTSQEAGEPQVNTVSQEKKASPADVPSPRTPVSPSVSAIEGAELTAKELVQSSDS